MSIDNTITSHFSIQPVKESIKGFRNEYSKFMERLAIDQRISLIC
jgi:hypothetical protein